MVDAEVIAFATPSIFARCAADEDPARSLQSSVPSNYAFRDIYLLATAADSAESSMDGPSKAWRADRLFEKAALRGVVRGTGADEPDDPTFPP
ncbi:MAG: hypothetical protein ACLUPV_09970 [Bilophila wadsworthia]